MAFGDRFSYRYCSLFKCNCRPTSIEVGAYIMTVYIRVCIFIDGKLIIRPSSLGGGRILRRTLSVCLSVCPSVPCVPFWSVTWRHLANYNDTLRAA